MISRLIQPLPRVLRLSCLRLSLLPTQIHSMILPALITLGFKWTLTAPVLLFSFYILPHSCFPCSIISPRLFLNLYYFPTAVSHSLYSLLFAHSFVAFCLLLILEFSCCVSIDKPFRSSWWGAKQKHRFSQPFRFAFYRKYNCGAGVPIFCTSAFDFKSFFVTGQQSVRGDIVIGSDG